MGPEATTRPCLVAQQAGNLSPQFQSFVKEGDVDGKSRFVGFIRLLTGCGVLGEFELESGQLEVRI